MNEDWMKRLNTMIASGEPSKVLSDKVVEINGRALTEEELVREELKKMSTVKISNRDITLPGLGDPAVQELIVAAVADFKKESNVSRVVKPEYLASIDDITIIPLRPEVFGVNDYIQTGLTAGTTTRILPKEGTPAGPAGVGEVTSDGFFKVNPKEARIIITDFVEFSPDTPITATKFNVDDEPRFPYEMRLEMKESDLQMYRLPSPEITRIKLKVDGKVETDGDSELTPFGVVIVVGEKVPELL